MNPQIKIGEACKPLNLLMIVFCLVLSACNGGGSSGLSRITGQDDFLSQGGLSCQEVHRSPRWESEMVLNRLEGNPGEPEFTVHGQIPAYETWSEMDYWIYQPSSAGEHPDPMLVIYFHGTSQAPIPAVDLSHFAPSDAESRDAYPYQIYQYRDREDRVVVESWYIHGLAHNYPYGHPEGDFTDPKEARYHSSGLSVLRRSARLPIA